MTLTISYCYPQSKIKKAKIQRSLVACPRSHSMDDSIRTIALGLSPPALGPGEFRSLANKDECLDNPQAGSCVCPMRNTQHLDPTCPRGHSSPEQLLGKDPVLEWPPQLVEASLGDPAQRNWRQGINRA